MDIHLPFASWGGPRTMLHLRIIDGTVCLFDAEGRMVDSVVSVEVRQAVEEPTIVTVCMYVETPPACAAD